MEFEGGDMRAARFVAILAVTLGASPLVAPPAAAHTQRSPSVVQSFPPARSDAAMASDPNGHVVLFGGERPNAYGSYDFLADTWVWDGSAWNVQHPQPHPGPRAGAFIAYDPLRNKVVLFGGSNDAVYFDDTWIWDGSKWARQRPLTSPPGECCSSMAWDETTKRVILFDGATWAWDGSNWARQHASKSPGARSFPAIARSGDHIVLNGGDSCLEDCFYTRSTWTWDGITWSKDHPTAGPSPRSGAAIAADLSTAQTVLFGGNNEYNGLYDFGDTWVWDGADWIPQHPADHPSRRERAGMAYDYTTGLLVLFGGDGAQFLNDTWTWDGSNWTCALGCP